MLLSWMGERSMLEWLQGVFESNFMPHGFCMRWEPGVVWLHAISDILIALAYYSIPILLFTITRKRKDLPSQPMFLAFAAFILACGTTHVMGVVTLWKPLYWLDGSIKAATALVSVVTAILLGPMVPRILALPSPAQLRQINHKLQTEIAERIRVEAHLRDARDHLEARVRERTGELEAEITERKRTEAALRRSERRLALALQASRMGTWEMDLASRQLQWDSDALAILERNGSSDSRGGFQVIHPEDRPHRDPPAAARYPGHSIEWLQRGRGHVRRRQRRRLPPETVPRRRADRNRAPAARRLKPCNL
jgi:PAS domain-containing protein